ncbi:MULTISPECIES: SDR family NAD(P)-dependent oxidoreductase [unclassified Novosphingobium]|uniref:SDR family NAD(P)-dependent oxidoreductase n=1 Tax=unclassified Novosphingobium TaxID=2644732 RepID=UPI000D2FBB1B|nr:MULTISPECIES: SDR family NAD(P)-dependent oxidoreductase [unclassified Novosphingobium]PTR12563.1 NAD(P)-dependent dehydrogenase (short-subunit alcohol dehydrogenase family) [Novosphingobium sp. GV055]PUB06347.1 NAD(P)-dependent dehydrogenase (short-subunit alcohol dehydrogenase family) [Novosphingobium sp. GV061]PUB22398.1 NAD(P)-dependent dehydrogenase (short-subunit alcohol dehydrogenase family) [Novosphingobium sp. GV079]PUB44423.1 NAD(P)-dependent dehydrogenase (short-subunit alcohol de
MEISGVTAVVTGGASGLGEATARALAGAGVKVAIFDLNREKGEALAAEIGGVFCEVDITSDTSVDAGFAKARTTLGQERILVNCAGRGNTFKTAQVLRETGEISHFPIDQFEKVVMLNLVGTFRCVAKSAAGMLTLDPLNEDGERGVIVNTASVAAIDGQAGQAAYASSKAGIVGLTLPIARDLRKNGIRCNAILPGIMDTPLFATARPELRKQLGDSVPFPRRMGQPEEFASLAVEMCRNSYMNGEHVRLDGAIRM